MLQKYNLSWTSAILSAGYKNIYHDPHVTGPSDLAKHISYHSQLNQMNERQTEQTRTLRMSMITGQNTTKAITKHF